MCHKFGRDKPVFGGIKGPSCLDMFGEQSCFITGEKGEYAQVGQHIIELD